MMDGAGRLGVKMNAGTDVRKLLRARKTMAPSSRRQIKILSKVKEAAEMTPDGASVKDKDLCTTSSDVQRFLNAGALQDILYSWYENESSSPLCKPVEVHLKPEPAGRTSGCSEGPCSVSSPAEDIPILSKVTNTGEMVVSEIIPVLEREDASFPLCKKNTAPFVPDDPRGKRSTPGGRADTFCKRVRTSGDAGGGCWGSSAQRQPGLGKVKGFIQQQLAASMSTLDRQLQRLNERIDHTKCLRKHEGIAMNIVKKISRLDRRINGVVASQKRESSSTVNLRAENKILNGTTALPSDASSSSMQSTAVPPPNPHETPSEAAGRSDDVICLDEVNKNSGVRTANPPGTKK